MTYYY